MTRPLLVVLGLLFAACAQAPTASLRFTAVEQGAPPYGTVPFPSDLYRGEDGLLLPFAGVEDITPLRAAIVSAHVTTLDGFGLRPVMDVFFDGALDPASVPASSTTTSDGIFLIDVDPASPARGDVLPTEWRVDPPRQRIAGVPRVGTVLREGTRYAVVVRRALRDDNGTTIPPPEAFVAQPPRDAQDALDALAALGVDDVALLSTFTTQRATRALLLARQATEAAPDPTITFTDPELVFRGTTALDALLGVAARCELDRERWGWSNPTGMAHDHVGVIATGTLTAPRFLTEDDGSFLPHADAFTYDDDGAPLILDPAATMPVTLALPATPAPAAGYPVAIFGHGLGASRHQLLALAEPLTARGWAVAAVDMNGFGSRFNPRDEKNNTADHHRDFSGDPTLRDGLGDVVGFGSTFAFLHEMKNLTALRDSIRQSALDQGALARALRAESLDLTLLAGDAPAPRLDGAHVVYLGESFGGVVGSVLAAIEPELDLFVLDVPGGGVVLDLALLGSPTMRPLVELWLSSTYGLDERLDRYHPAIGLGQAVIDGADPLSFAPHVLRDRLHVEGVEPGPRHVVLIEAVGDEVMPNRSTHALARAFGAPLLAPFSTPVDGLNVVEGPQRANVDGQTAALVQWSPATHGANWTSETGERKFMPFGEGDDEVYEPLDATERIENPMRATLAQVTALLDSYLEGAPTLSPTQVAEPR